MEETVSSRPSGGCHLNLPPMKMLAGCLRECKKKSGDTSSFWMDGPHGQDVEVGLVWMQGRVTEVRPDRGTTIRITDDTHTFTVCGADKVPKGKPFLEKGKYVMVMGSVLSCSPEPVLRAVKITDLSDNPVHQSMWKLEVDDFHVNSKCTKNV
ncbi:recQ-mediated genome instability protein 2 [Spea bombifrons]|uniref:recQ-mediated genome instability protein 2 n=1 Tax=Spea bombifrons TaxID=233779 RepID=UPI00234B7CF2|nr:recQ-mediated genome instability protein 2 [Spea bombifrons]XP_053317927.1 recQ-mediated genome instability protein 2 [Spea bombifrons]